MPRKASTSARRRICFVTGTRAEFGLMQSVLKAIREDPSLQLQIIVTGMHLDADRGKTIDGIKSDGWHVDAVVPWLHESRAVATGDAIVGITRALGRLKPDVLLVVGDRVEAFAAATAGHLCDIAVAHVHGGDRALGQMDDTLRHAITKLAHLHFPATRESAGRILHMGEDAWRIHRVGSPGIDGIRESAASGQELQTAFPNLRKRQFALIAFHPVEADEDKEFKRAQQIVEGVLDAGIDRMVIVHPNNDPGSAGIIRAWEMLADDSRCMVKANLPRRIFLGLLRDSAMLVGNSSAGIIEAGSFGTPVIDIGPRQLGRERGSNILQIAYGRTAVASAAADIWDGGHPKRAKGSNPYGVGGAGVKIAKILSKTAINARLLRKIIAY